MKLDLKDHKILYELDLNSRATLGEIAKKVGLSKQLVDYRLKNLIKSGVIKQFYAVVNFSKLGYTQYKLYLKFQNLNLEKEKEIIDFWVKNKHSVWVGSCRGRWDLAISLLARNVNQLGEIINDFTTKYGLFILEKDVLITQSSPVFTKGYLTDKKEKKSFIYGGEIGAEELDETDQSILKTISQNARLSILEMMNKLHLTREVISYRLKRMVKGQIIKQCRTLIDLNKIGYKLYKIILRLHSLTPEKEKQLITYLSLHPQGTQYLKLIGSWEAELEFEVHDEEQLHHILGEIRKQFSEIIRDYDTLLISQEYKLNYYPF